MVPPAASSYDARPPGAPRKQPASAVPSAAIDSSNSSTSSVASALRHDVAAAYDAAESLFNDATGPSVEAGNQGASRGTQSWLSRRMLPPSDFERPSTAYADTPTGRHQHAHGPSSSNGPSYRTPSVARPPPSSLYEQLARGMAASRRQHGNARVSLASSSGWGSPRMGSANGLGIAQNLSGDHSSSAGPSRLPSRMEGSLFDTPRTPSGGELSQLRPPPVPRFSFPHNPAAPLNQDGSYSVIRDEDEANNSGLLALSPAVRRINGLGITPIQPRPSKGSDASSGGDGKAVSDPSERQSNATMIEHALDVETASQDEIETRRAQLLQSGTLAPREDYSALLELMRNWREDAMKHHLYDTAIFWGDKILTLETDQIAWNDAYNLATAYFLTHRYAQAEHLLCTPLRLSRPAEERLSNKVRGDDARRQTEAESDELGAALSATHRSSKLPPSMLARSHPRADHARSSSGSYEDINDDMDDVRDYLERKRKDRHFAISATGTGSKGTSAGASNAGDINGDADSAGTRGHAVNGEESNEKHSTGDRVAEAWREEQRLAMEEVREFELLPPDSVSLVSVSIPCKYLAAQCMVRQGKYQEALDELSGWKGDSIEQVEQNYKQPSKDGLIKLSSSIWHLKGLIQLHLRNIDEARESFMRSLSLDVKNYESFDQLVRGHLLSASQQWDFIENLEYVAQAGDDPVQVEALQVVRLLYTARLDKNGRLHAQQAAASRRQLTGLYCLGDNPDVLLGLAEEMFTRMRYEDSYTVTQRIMDLSKDHEAALPIHISSMFMIERLRPSLYLLAHHLTDTDPDLAAGWYAVGCWYFSTRRWLEARKHFSKCVQMEPRFAPGWIAFAHTFAHEGESDQAVISYSTAERSFSAHYLVKLFLGMEHLAQGNLTLAELYLGGSAEVWEEDALSRNERGVVAYYAGRTDEAIVLFRSALAAAKDVQQPPVAWTATHLNLGYALRKTGQLQLARSSFLRALELDPDLAAAYTGVGMCYHGEGDIDEAIVWYHRTLAVSPSDKHANDLLSFALQENAQRPPDDLMAAADQLIEESDRRMAAAGEATGGSTPKLKDPFGIRIEVGQQSASGQYGDGTREMTLAEGSASIDMDESY